MIEIFLFLVIIGVIAGFLGSIIGVGGGVIISPALTFLGFSPSHVASTSLIAITSTSISSTLAYSKVHRIKYRIGLKIAVLSIPGAIVGALLSTSISPTYFKLGFTILLFVVGVYLIYRKSVIEKKADSGSNWVKALFYISSLIAGLISSLFGIGGGVIFVPVLIIIVGLKMSYAAPTSQFTLMLTSLIGTITHVVLGNPEYIHSIILSTGSFIGAQIGAMISLKLNENTLRNILAISLIGMGIKFILDIKI